MCLNRVGFTVTAYKDGLYLLLCHISVYPSVCSSLVSMTSYFTNHYNHSPACLCYITILFYFFNEFDHKGRNILELRAKEGPVLFSVNEGVCVESM